MQSGSQPVTTLENRSLGLGFGKNNHFYVRLSEPNKLMIGELPFPSEVMMEFREALQVEITKAKADKTAAANITTILTRVLEKDYQQDDVKNMVSLSLALIIPDVLVDANITRLNEHALPKMMKDADLKRMLGKGLNKFFIFKDDGNLDFLVGMGKNNAPVYKPDVYFNYDDMQNEDNQTTREDAQISQRFLKSLIVSKYIKEFGIPANMQNNERMIDEWKNKIVKEQLAVILYDLTGNIPKEIQLKNIHPKINLSDNDIYAYLVPAIIDRMKDEDLQTAASRVAGHLAVTDFKPLAYEDYARLQLKLAPQAASLTNANQRSLQFFTQPGGEAKNDSGLDFRGKKYQFQHTHIHFEKDGEEKEFVVKNTQGEVLNFDGEVHTVFEYTPPEKVGKTNRQKRMIAVHYPLKVEGGDNADVQELLSDIDVNKQKWEAEVKQWENRENKQDNAAKPRLNLAKMLDFGKVFLNSLNDQSEKGQLLHHSWASWRSGTHAFKSGLRFIISTQPIRVSQAQYDKLKKVFGEMRNDLKEEEILDPIDRKAGWRKERTALTQKLSHLMTSKPGIQLR
jgi:hypothetical protein